MGQSDATEHCQDQIIYSHSAPITELGGKAFALAQLSQAGFEIPAWFVVSPRAFERCLQEEQRSLLQAENFAQLFASLQIEGDVREQIQLALRQVFQPDDLVAVRSSAIAEDGSAHSFAGQFESYLCVRQDNVCDRILDVWRSAFSDRLLSYCQEHHLPHPGVPAVLIQKMVAADVAGVAFSANPVTGQRGMVVVSAVAGLGDRLVSGETDAETYHVDRSNTITHISPTSEHSTPLLRAAQIHAIAHLARRAERHCHRPQDIEWAIQDDQLYLLQSRPITTLEHLPDPDSTFTIWDNSNIAESYGGITTPLTYTFARGAYEAVYRQFCRMMGVSERAIAQQEQTFRCMIGLVQGRIYYNLLNWYRVLALLPGFTVNRRFMEQMMGVREELPADVVAQLAQASLGDKLWDSLHLVSTILGLLKNYATLPRQIRRFYQRLDQALSLPPTALETMRLDELVQHYHDLERQLLTRWDAPLVNDFFAMIFYGVLRTLTTRWCGDVEGTLQNDLISGAGGMVSAEPAQRLRQMAHLAATSPALIQELLEGTRWEMERAIATVPELQRLYCDYLEKFGDRCLEELKLESPTLHDDPTLLLRSVGSLAQSIASTPTMGPHREKVAFEADLSPRQRAEEKVHHALRHSPLRRWIFGWVLNNARARVRDRENLRFERTRVFGRVRRIMVEIGDRLFAQNKLQHPRDIFYLTLDEVLGYCDGTTAATDFPGLVSVRKAEFERYHHQPAPPNRFSTHGSPAAGITAVAAPTSAEQIWVRQAGTLQGTGCCPGTVRATVQVITDPNQAVLRPGSILVAERTDPGWIMLFPAAAGILVERGSLLSHAAIVAREMNIPAIVSVPHLMHSVKDGDWVEMDGRTGMIRILEPEDGAIAIGNAETKEV